MATTLSDKVKATVAAMGLTDAMFEVAPIKWVKELRKVRGEVCCPTCEGNKFVIRDENDVVLKFDDINSLQAREARIAMRRRGDNGYCYTCSNPRKQGGYPQGVVKAMVERMVDVGHIQWPEGTKFDSRFGHCDCNACGKNGIVSGTVPMMAQDASGTYHGVLMGHDCATKFFGLSKEQKKTLVGDDKILE